MTVVPSELRRANDHGGPGFAPYASGRFPIDTYDYVEEEWVASGVENGDTYETIVLVRRPRDPARFSGTVLVEPLHVHGIVPMAVYCSTYVMREGHGWAMVASQRTTIHDHVTPANPSRYATLHIAGPGEPRLGIDVDFRTPEALAAFWSEMREENRSSSRILAQVGAALRAPNGPYGPAGAAHLVLMGHSQTGSVVTYYLSDAHDSERLADGRPVYDGLAPTGFPVDALGPCDVPIVQIMSDGDVSDPVGTFVVGHPDRPYRRADSDDPADRFRLYELAGVPHMGTRHRPFDDAELWRQSSPDVFLPDGVVMSSLPHNELFSVCLDHLVRWVAHDTAPPKADRLVVGPDGRFLTDDAGNTLGGVRCVQMDVPRARYQPNAPEEDGSPSAHTIGTETPLSDTEMRERYGSRDAYVARFEQRVVELIDAGWLLPADAEYMHDDLSRVAEF